MKSRRKVVAILCILGALGCNSTNAVRLGNSPTRPKIAVDQVVVYRTAAQVPGKYEEIALLSATANAAGTQEGMVKTMRAKAGAMGANAIILDTLIEPSAAAKAVGTFLGTAERKGKAIAIYVLADSTQKKP